MKKLNREIREGKEGTTGKSRGSSEIKRLQAELERIKRATEHLFPKCPVCGYDGKDHSLDRF